MMGGGREGRSREIIDSCVLDTVVPSREKISSVQEKARSVVETVGTETEQLRADLSGALRKIVDVAESFGLDKITIMALMAGGLDVNSDRIVDKLVNFFNGKNLTDDWEKEDWVRFARGINAVGMELTSVPVVGKVVAEALRADENGIDVTSKPDGIQGRVWVKLSDDEKKLIISSVGVLGNFVKFAKEEGTDMAIAGGIGVITKWLGNVKKRELSPINKAIINALGVGGGVAKSILPKGTRLGHYAAMLEKMDTLAKVCLMYEKEGDTWRTPFKRMMFAIGIGTIPQGIWDRVQRWENRNSNADSADVAADSAPAPAAT